MKRYNPRIVDTSAIELSPELVELTEAMAANVPPIGASL